MPKPIAIHGVPMDIGQMRRGVDMGASAIRYAGLQTRLQNLGWHVTDMGNISVPDTSSQPHDDIPNAHNSTAVAAIAQQAYIAMQRTISHNQIAIFLGGDHSCAIGTLAGSITRPERTGIVWVDAHADFNTPSTSPSGSIHGMVVSSVMGMCPAPLQIGTTRLMPDQIVMIAIRDLDREERMALRQSGITVYTMRDIDEHGIAVIMRKTLEQFANVEAIHVSFDMDSLDPTVAPGVGTPVSGGLSIREAHLTTPKRSLHSI
jgi:arginase